MRKGSIVRSHFRQTQCTGLREWLPHRLQCNGSTYSMNYLPPGIFINLVLCLSLISSFPPVFYEAEVIFPTIIQAL